MVKLVAFPNGCADWDASCRPNESPMRRLIGGAVWLLIRRLTGARDHAADFPWRTHILRIKTEGDGIHNY